MIVATKLKALLKREPYRMLRLTMSSGRTFEVRHPEMMEPGPVDIEYFLPGSNGAPDRQMTLSYMHVESVEYELPTDDDSGTA